jgi:hypothetical protein
MTKQGLDRVTTLAANISSPEVIPQIDEALGEMREEWLELLDLRKMAVRRHGETAPAPTMPGAPTEPIPPSQIDRKNDGEVLSVASLIARYKADKDSPYGKLRYRTREHYEGLMRRIERDIGTELIRDIDGGDILRFHEEWTASGASMAHALVTMLRGLFAFGANVLKNKDCRELKFTMSEMKFQQTKVQSERLTVEQVRAIIDQAHKMDLASIAIAQAFQFDCGLRQRDVIGEWVPYNEPGDSHGVNDGAQKWLRGIRWDQIDKDLVLRHSPSNGGKMIEAHLSECSLVGEELARMGQLPKYGPIVINEATGLPYTAWEFRRLWREVADAAGMPKHVKNMNTRAPRDSDD